MMPGVTFEEVRNQIIDAYEQDELKMLLRERMNVRLDRVIAPGTFDYQVFQLLGWAERMGREVELIRVAARARPEHQGMQAVYQKYGLAIPVYLQQAGQPLGPIPLPATDGGFEVQVRKTIPYLDVGIWREQLSALEGRVCRVEVGDPAGLMGTGFLIGPDAVLTNYHVVQPVIEKRSSCDRVRCRFDFKRLANGADAEGVVVGLRSDWLIDASKYSDAEAARSPTPPDPSPDELDYALVRLARPLGREPLDPNPRPGATGVPTRGWIQVPSAPPSLTRQMPLAVLQHPNQESLKLALDTEGVTEVNPSGTRVRYKTNTEAGSSGAPCFDLKWNLVALHHYGDPAFDGFTRLGDWNQGVPIGMIRDRLTRLGKADALGGNPL